jgi:DNA-binding MarR family transcriptional regulator
MRDPDAYVENRELSRLNALAVAFEHLNTGWRTKLGISAHERIALGYLWYFGSMTVGELGDKIPLSRAAMTTLCERLESLEYIRRTTDPNDRRRTFVHLTDKPRAELSELSTPLEERITEMRAAFSEEQLAVIDRYIDSVEETVSEHARSMTIEGRVAAPIR